MNATCSYDDMDMIWIVLVVGVASYLVLMF